MKKQKGLGLIGILLIIGALLLTAGGVVGLPAVRQVWQRKVPPAPIPIWDDNAIGIFDMNSRYTLETVSFE